MSVKQLIMKKKKIPKVILIAFIMHYETVTNLKQLLSEKSYFCFKKLNGNCYWIK